MKKTILADIISLLFIVLFAYAAVSKLLDYQKFRVQIGQSPLLTSLAAPVSIGIPVLEIVLASMLASKRYRLKGLFASFTLMVLFSAYIIAITSFSDYVPCSCGGILQKMSWGQHLTFNLIFVGLGAIAVLVCDADTHEHKKIVAT